MQTFDALTNFKDYLQIFGAGVGGLITIATIWWKISKTFHTTQTKLDSIEENLEKLEKSNQQLIKAIVKLSTRMEAQDKDITKLEGALELGRKQFTEIGTQLQTNTISLQMMWRALEKLFPKEIIRTGGP